MSKKVGWKKKALLGTALAAAALTDPVGGYGNIYKQMSYKIENAPCNDVNKIYRTAIQQHMKSNLGLNPSADSTEQFQRLHDAKAKALERCGKKTNKQRVDEEDAEEKAKLSAKLSAKRGASQKRDKEREESAKAQREETQKKESAKAQGEKKPSSGEEDTKKRQTEADEKSKRRFGTGSYDTDEGGIWGNVAKVVGAVGTIGAVAAGAKKIQEINAAQRLGISTNPLVWDEYDRVDIHEEIARHNDELEAARKERVRRSTPTSERRKRLTGGRTKIRTRKRTKKRKTRKTRRASPKRRKRRKQRRTRKGGTRRHN